MRNMLIPVKIPSTEDIIELALKNKNSIASSMFLGGRCGGESTLSPENLSNHIGSNIQVELDSIIGSDDFGRF